MQRTTLYIKQHAELETSSITIQVSIKSMANLWFLLSLAVYCGCCACISAQAQTCPPPLPSSCQEAYRAAKCANKTPTDGEYTIAFMSNGNRVERKVFCDMTHTYCGPDKGWMRVAELDMTLLGSKCPPGLDEGMYGSKRLCGNRGSGCKSTMFNTFGFPHTQVCGFVAGYQYNTPNAFNGKTISIDSTYLDGISITHGSKPRKHIWSYAASCASGASDDLNGCPCSQGSTQRIPTYVKDNYYCESGNPTDQVLYRFFPNDVLWDGKDCTLKEPPCCQAPTMPYFKADVDGVSTDPIELRVCHNELFDNEDAPVESYKFFIR